MKMLTDLTDVVFVNRLHAVRKGLSNSISANLKEFKMGNLEYLVCSHK